MNRRVFIVLAAFAVGMVTAPAAAEPVANSADLVFWACLATFLIAAAPFATSRRPE